MVSSGIVEINMSVLLLLKIVLFVAAIYLTFDIVATLLVVFYQKATEKVVEEVLKNPSKYVRTEYMVKFIRNMVYLYIVIMILMMLFRGNITVITK